MISMSPFSTRQLLFIRIWIFLNCTNKSIFYMNKRTLSIELFDGDSGKGIIKIKDRYLISTKILAEEKGVSEGTIKNRIKDLHFNLLRRNDWPKDLEPSIQEFHEKNNHSRSQKTMYRLWDIVKPSKHDEQNEGENEEQKEGENEEHIDWEMMIDNSRNSCEDDEIWKNI